MWSSAGRRLVYFNYALYDVAPTEPGPTPSYGRSFNATLLTSLMLTFLGSRWALARGRRRDLLATARTV